MLAAGMDARSYARVLGANDRIRLGSLAAGTAVKAMSTWCIWRRNRCRWRRSRSVTSGVWPGSTGQPRSKRAFNLEPQTYKYSEEMLARKDIDGVMIATGDFQHAKLCIEVVQAGKDCYVEKPFANVLSEAKEARDAVKQSKQVVQMGTQHRSQPYPLAVRDIIRSGRIGKIVHIEQEWNVNEERWRFNPNGYRHHPRNADGRNLEWKQWLYGRKSKLREEDTDWKRWLLGKPDRPFDPHVYLEFRLV